MLPRQADFHERIRRRLEDFLSLAAPIRRDEPQPFHGEAERLAQDRQIDLQAIVALQGPPTAEAQAGFRSAAVDVLHLADDGAAMAYRIAVGDFLVLVRLHEQVRPRPAEDALHLRFQLRTLL